MDVGLISIHTALAGCDEKYDMWYARYAISIHTALAGCDKDYNNYFKVINIFQSTQPSQAVTFNVYGYATHQVFQSTQPSQAVTLKANTYAPQINISIHTALAGCDS